MTGNPAAGFIAGLNARLRTAMIIDPPGSGIRPVYAITIWSGVARGYGPMSMDKSLKKAGGLARSRNVLTRSERLALLQEDEKWIPSKGVFNLPKTKYRRLAPGQSGPKRPGV